MHEAAALGQILDMVSTPRVRLVRDPRRALSLGLTSDGNESTLVTCQTDKRRRRRLTPFKQYNPGTFPRPPVSGGINVLPRHQSSIVVKDDLSQGDDLIADDSEPCDPKRPRLAINIRERPSKLPRFPIRRPVGHQNVFGARIVIPEGADRYIPATKGRDDLESPSLEEWASSKRFPM